MTSPQPSAAIFRATAGAATDAGRARTHNEDSYLAATPVFLVADGMGGHTRGAAASARVVRGFEPLAGRDWVSPAELHDAVTRAAASVGELAGDGPAPGSTLTGVALTRADGRPCWLVFNVGDSRAYLMRDGALEQVSVDHSRRQELLEAGTPEDSIMVGRNVITRALGGGRGGVPIVDQWLLPAAQGDRLLVCSDGLSTEVSAPLIAAILGSQPDPRDAARELVAAALEAGGRDNVTVVVVDAVEVTGGMVSDDDDTLRPSSSPVTVDDDTLELPALISSAPKE